MNKIYKLVWSKVRCCWVAVAETAKSDAKSPQGTGGVLVYLDSRAKRLSGTLMRGGKVAVITALCLMAGHAYDIASAVLGADGMVHKAEAAVTWRTVATDTNQKVSGATTTVAGYLPRTSISSSGETAYVPQTNITISKATTSVSTTNSSQAYYIGYDDAANKLYFNTSDSTTGATQIQLKNYTLPSATASVLGGVKVGSNITNSGGTISLTKANVVAALGYTPPTADTDTHWTSHMFVGTGAAANAATTNGNTKIALADNSTVRNTLTIKGTGATTVTSDANGVITVNSANTTYTAMTAAEATAGTATTARSITPKVLGDYVKSQTNDKITNLSVSGKTITFTKGDGTTGTITTQDTDTKYTAGSGLALSGTTFSVNANGAIASGNANPLKGGTVFTEVRPTADGSFIKKANTTAANLTALDGAAKNAIKSLSVNGKVITYTKGDGTTGTITTQDTNTTYAAFKGATADAAGGAGLVTAPAKGQQNYVLHGDGTWKADANTTYAAMTAAEATTGTATTARSITAKVLGDYVKSKTDDKITNLSVSGKTITFTKGDGTTGTIATQDTNTTYSAGDGLALTGTTLNVKKDGKIESGNTGVVTGGKVYDAISRMIQYDEGSNETATLVGKGGTKLTNLKAATLSKTSKDAVTGAQLFATNTNIEGFAQDIRRNANSIQTLNSSVSNALASVTAANTLVNTVNDLKADASLNNLTAAGRQVIANAAADAVQQYMADRNRSNGNSSAVNMSHMAVPASTSMLTASLRTVPMALDLDAMLLGDTPDVSNDDTSAGGTGITAEDLALKADISYVDEGLAAKADTAYVDAGLALKADKNDVYTKAEADSLLGGKADLAYVNTELGKKADLSYVDAGLSGKADRDAVYTKTETDGKLALKADLMYVEEGLSEKADISYVDEALAGKADKADLAAKADADGGNIDVDAWSGRLGIGEVSEGNTGLVNGGAVYDAIREAGNNGPVTVDDTYIHIGKAERYDNLRVVDISDSQGNGRVMTGVVVNPEDPSSAANVGYVSAVSQALADSVDRGFSRMNDKVNKVGANAAAMASLMPPPMDGDEKWAISAAVGNYRNATAGAIGAFYRPQDNVMLNVRGSFGDEENMIGGGVSVALNRGDTPAVSKAQLVRTVNAQAQELCAQAQAMEEMKADRLADKEAIANQAAEIAGLKKMIQEMQAKQNG